MQYVLSQVNRINNLMHSKFLKSVSALMTGAVLSQVIIFATSPILTRLYNPSNFGLLAIYVSIITFLGVVATGKYELALMLTDGDEETVNVFSLILLCVSIFSIICLTCVIFFNQGICHILKSHEIKNWLYFIPVSVFFLGLYQALSYWVNKKEKYVVLAKGGVIQNTGMTGTSIVAGLLSLEHYGLLFGKIAGGIVNTVYLSFSVFKNDWRLIRVVSLQKILYVARKYNKFPRFLMLSNFVNVFSVQCIPVVLALLFSTTIVGYYSLANRIVIIPVTLFSGIIQPVFFKKISSLKGDRDQLSSFALNAYKKILTLSALPVCSLLVFADYLFPFVFGAKWGISGVYCQSLCLWVFFVLIASPFSLIYVVLEMQQKILFYHISLFVLRLSALVVGGLYFHNAFLSVLLFGIVGAIANFIFCLCVLAELQISVYKSIYFAIKTLMFVITPLLMLRFLVFSG